MSHTMYLVQILYSSTYSTEMYSGDIKKSGDEQRSSVGTSFTGHGLPLAARVGKPLLIFLGDNQTCPRGAKTVLTSK